MKQEVPQRKGDQKIRRNNINLEATKAKRKSIRYIVLRHHHQAHFMRVIIETMRARKAQIPAFCGF